MEALRILSDAHKYIAFDLATHPQGVETVFRLLDLASESTILLSAAQVISTVLQSSHPLLLTLTPPLTLLHPIYHPPLSPPLPFTPPSTSSIQLLTTLSPLPPSSHPPLPPSSHPSSHPPSHPFTPSPSTFAVQLLTTLGRSSDFVSLAVKQDTEEYHSLSMTPQQQQQQPQPQHRPVSCVWRLLRNICTTSGANVDHLWSAAEGFASYPDGLGAILASGGVIHMLGILFGVPGYANQFQNRLAAVSLLSKFLWNPMRGADASTLLRKFLPEPMVVLLRSKAGSASLHALGASRGATPTFF